MKERVLNIFVKFLFLWTLAGFAAGCAPVFGPKRTVSIPPEYREPAPRPEPAPQKPGKKSRQAEAPEPEEPRGPVLEPFADIRVEDLESSQGSGEKEMPPGTDSAGASDASASQTASPSEPQQVASMHMVDQARTFMEQGDVDQAISTLEQSIQVDVYNGDAFYGLARAWRRKGDFQKALEFANKAAVLYKDNPARLKEVYRFQADIHMVLQDYEKADMYRKKADNL